MSTTQSLPRWDLTDFYPSIHSPEIEADKKWITERVDAFSKHQGTLKTKLDQLFALIKEYEAISMRLAKLGSYAYLTFATQMTDETIQRFQQALDEFATTVWTKILFFTHELNELEESDIKKAYDLNDDLKTYTVWLDNIRVYKPFQLDLNLEQVLPQKDLTGAQAWVRLYDQTLAEMSFTDNKGASLNLSQLLERMSHEDPALRKEAAELLSKEIGSKKTLFTLIFNTLLKDKEVMDSLRGYKAPWHARHLANQIEEEVVDALTQTVRANYGLCHRYYAWKAKQMGLSKIEYWDRNAPLKATADPETSWEEAKVIVLDAYGAFSKKLADVGKNFFDNPWIDVPPYAGKTSGAFAHPTTPDVHPYLMLNYTGKRRDVMTLAHELGHGVHQYLSNGQPYLLTGTPLTVAETASVFGEMLTFRSMLNACKNTEEKKHLLAGKIEDMINTVFRQVAFHQFEVALHTKRKEGELTYDDFAKIWIDTQREALGDAVKLDTMISNFWAYISHFIHVPFYVYAYAFGDCLVNSLYSVYQKGTVDHFQDKYLNLLSQGGSKKYDELLEPFGLNPKDKTFWQGGLDVIKGLVEELESLN